MSHGWGSSALVAMQESLLGVTLLTPGDDGAVSAAIAPPMAGMTGARGSFPSIAGPISVTWSRHRPALSLATVIPPNASAHITIPAASVAAVREGGAALQQASGVTLESFQDGVAVLGVGSGSYQFTATTS
jgi:hypothetical protein